MAKTTTVTSSRIGKSSIKKASRAPCANEEERRERRRAANRRSAQKSRYREMILMDELQKTVSELTRRNAQLRESNSSFRGDVMVLKKLLERREEAKERLGSAATMVSQHTCASIMRVCVCVFV